LGSRCSPTRRKRKTFGAVLGYYGLAWSVYNTIFSRDSEVEFRKNAAIDVRFGGTAQTKK
jgi:hypothetical protein